MIPVFCSVLLLSADPAPAPAPGADEIIQKYLAGEVDRLEKQFLEGATSRAEWEARKPRLKQEFLDMLGLWPLPPKTDLKPTVTRTFERDGIIIENLHFQSSPGLYVTGNLCRPKEIPAGKKLPTVLYVCGHSNQGRDGNKSNYQDHGRWFAANGYVCLTVDTLQLGEIAGKHHGTYNLQRFWWHSRGYTSAGVECWNGIRAIDYLITRPEVDPNRIGVTGISGGGASTVWIAAADDRVKVAVPVSGMSDLSSYVKDQVVNGHCDCMFFYNVYQWEWTTALALFAPRPLLFANSDNDRIFPMDGNRRIIERLRGCYKMYNAESKVDEFVSMGGHAYRPDLRIAIFQFMNEYLKQEQTPVKDIDFERIPGMELRVFPTDADLPTDSINDRADEHFVPVAKVKLPERGFESWKNALVWQIRARSFRALPEKVTAAEYQPARGTTPAGYVTEPGMRLQVAGLRSMPDAAVRLRVALNPDDAGAKDVDLFAKRYPSAHVLATFPRGGGPHAWTRKNPPNTYERSLLLLGQTADTGRVRDLMALVADDATSGQKVRLAGRGQAGVNAAYAALLSPGTVEEVIIIDPPVNHREGPHFLGIDRVVDLPTALGLLAPQVKLRLVNAADPAFDRTEAMYKLAGVADHFSREK